MTKTTESLAEKVRNYLKRTDSYATRLPLEQEADYLIMSGTTDERGDRYEVGIYHGRFIDAVVKAVASPSYGGWWVTHDDHPDNGYVQLFAPEIKHLPRLEGIVEYVTKRDMLEQERSSLERKMIALERQMRDD
jgi:hypothetical protein